MQNEVSNDLLLSIAEAISHDKPEFQGTQWFGIVKDAGKIAGCLVYEELDGLVASEIPIGSMDLVCDELRGARLPISKINGPSETAEALANAWCSDNAATWEISHKWQAYVLDRLQWPSAPARGVLRQTYDSERSLIEDWGHDYGVESPAPIPVPDFLMRKIEEQKLFVWDDEGPRMLVCISDCTKNCVRISAVYTPPEYRSQGYASTAVATVAKKIIDEGYKYCTLVVDCNDALVMKLYERLGFLRTLVRSTITIQRI